MIHDKNKALLKRYRHLIAALISYSIGYFTPLAALQAIKDYKNNKPNFCEWYLDIAWKRGTRDCGQNMIKYISGEVEWHMN